MTRALVTQMLEALDESRGDVSQCLQEVGYVGDDEWIKAITEQLEKHDAAITAACEYLATEPSGDLASLLRRANTSVAALDSRIMEPFYCALDQDASRVLSDCIDMLEADAQQATHDIKALQSNGKGPAPCARFCEANAFQIEIRRLKAEINAQQAKRVPMTDEKIQEIYIHTYTAVDHGRDFENAFARAIEAHHGIHAPK